MSIIPIDLPPGFYKNGTPYTRKNRVQGGNLVRYHDGSYRPIGGWLRRTETATDGEIAALVADPAAEAVRDITAWRDNGQALNAVFFSNAGAYHLSATGATTDVTPAGFVPINATKDTLTERGYGQGAYGVGAYGAATDLSGREVVPPDRWYSGVFGEMLLFGAIRNGPMYELNLSDLSVSQVANAPEDNSDICVTEQRQVFTVGAGGEPRRVRSTEVEDRTDWTPSIANQSIDRVLPGNGRLVRCVPVQNEVLVLGEQDAFAARYVGPPYVYSIEEVGTNCGPLAPQALAKSSNFAVWWGSRNFWIYNGSVQPIECEVIDFLYEDIDPNEFAKISAFTNVDYSEIWWLYQSVNSDEVDSYVAWDYRRNVWTTGRISRTAGVDKNVFTTVVMISQNGEIYNHELTDVFPQDGGSVFVETGPLDLQNGARNMAVRYIYPDQEQLEGVSYTLIGRQFPTADEFSYGPYPASNPTPTRALGRSIRLRADFTDATAELGLTRFDTDTVGTGQR